MFGHDWSLDTRPPKGGWEGPCAFLSSRLIQHSIISTALHALRSTKLPAESAGTGSQMRRELKPCPSVHTHSCAQARHHFELDGWQDGRVDEESWPEIALAISRR